MMRHRGKGEGEGEGEAVKGIDGIYYSDVLVEGRREEGGGRRQSRSASRGTTISASHK
jgi:hypothetical protein